jgi:hypothetical protein
MWAWQNLLRSVLGGDRIQIGPVLIIFHASSSGISTEAIVPLT